MKTKIFTFSSLFLLVALSVQATTYYVRSSGSDGSDGSLTTPLLTVSKALDLVSTNGANGDIIDISGTVNFFSNAAMRSITKSITIQGDNKSTAIVQGLASGNVTGMQIGTNSITYTPTVTIKDLTFQGFTSYNTYVVGGVIQLYQGTLTCLNVNFMNNSAYTGGAVGILTVNDNASIGAATFNDCYFYNNQSQKTTGNTYASGGAIYISVDNAATTSKVDVAIDRCTFEANTAEFFASALYCKFNNTSAKASTLLVQNSTFANNVLKIGGLNAGSQNPGYGCITTEGTNGSNMSGSSMVFKNNTIAYNRTERAKTGGNESPGFHIQSGVGMVTFINNILFSNTFPSLEVSSYTTYQNFLETRNNIADNWNGFPSAVSSGNKQGVGSASLLLSATLADNGGGIRTLSIGTGSNAIDAGYVTGAPTIDQRNYNRVGIPDIGAYEVAGTLTSINSSTELKDILIVKSGVLANTNGKIQIYTVDGKLLINERISSGQTIVLNRGIYIVRMISSKGSSNQKVML